ncbi:MAG: hypothetical protein IT373_10650 [Polyangiaceae bacterium]|nr:hypothetical protein [Polyangiaceae bacterium]
MTQLTRRTFRACCLAATAALAATAVFHSDAPAQAGSRFAFEPVMPELKRAVQYAGTSTELCFAELRDRGVPFEVAEAKRTVETPIRLTGPVRGVTFKPTYRDDPRPPGPWTIMDCRLALAVDDLAQLLSAHGVVEAEYLSLYRPSPGKPGVRHGAGRAIDLATVKLADGTLYSVQHDFHGRVGAQSCGEGADPAREDTPGARFWRDIVCGLDDRGSFNLVLSPNHDFGHRDHLHLEVRSGIRWFLIQ